MLDRTKLPIRIPRTPNENPAPDYRAQTEPYPPQAQVRAPEGAPNVLVILLDDMGFGASSVFGGPCRMPVAEELAAGGAHFNRFHTTAVCSPTRAALLTGRNHHTVGMGVVTDFASTAPGYTAMRPDEAATLAQILHGNGYATGCFGKWHQIPQHAITPAGPFDYWPTSEGFEHFYGFIGGADDHFYPNIYQGTTQIEPPATPEEGYHLSEDLIDQTITWVRNNRAVDKTRPWFAYLPFGATHSPFQVPESWKDRYRGEFSHGWDEQRERTLARQIELGVVPPGTELSPWPEGAPHWDELSDTEKVVAERLMEVYAAFAEHTDAQIGRLIEVLRAEGELDNTLIFYIMGDNGASAEGRLTGSFNEMRTYNGLPEPASEILPRLDEIGGPTSYVNYPVGWALAMDTPFQWTKQVASHFGGTRNGLVVHWPKGIRERGLRDQWHHIIDVAPTIMEAAGIPHPESVNGVEQWPIEGTSMLYALNDANAPDQHTTQYFEMFGNRGIYHEGWTAVAKHRTPWDLANREPIPFENDTWELYDITADFSQAKNLAEVYPEKLAELQELFHAEALKHNVLPLDDRGIERMAASIAGRPVNDVGRRLTVYPGTRRLEGGAFPTLSNRSFTITAQIEADSDASDGVILAIGTARMGYSLYVRQGIPTFVHNMASLELTHIRSTQRLTAGKHELEYRFHYDGGGVAQGGDGELLIDGEVVGQARVPRTAMFSGGRLTVGANPGTFVTDDYLATSGEYPYTGTIESVTLDAGGDREEPSPSAKLRAEMVEH